MQTGNIPLVEPIDLINHRVRQQPSVDSNSEQQSSLETGGEDTPRLENDDSQIQDSFHSIYDSSDDEMEKKNIMPRFEGDSSKVKVESWLAMFELVHDDITDNKAKIKKLITYLRDSAMDWFSDAIMPTMANDPQFLTIKTQMINRFKRDLVEPIIQVQNRRLQREETVTGYFNEKLQLLRRTGLSESGMIAMLTEGMPQHYRTALISARPTDTNAWLGLALDLESSFKQNKRFAREPLLPLVEGVHMAGRDRPNRDSRKSKPSSNDSKPPNRKPPGPCRYCKSRGLVEWHWNNECSNQTMAPRTPDETPATVNMASKNVNSDQRDS